MLKQTQRVFQAKYTYLLISLLILMFVSPFVVVSEFGRWIVGAMTLLVLLSAIYAMRQWRRVFIFLCVLALVSFVADFMNVLFGTTLTAILDQGIFAFFCFVTTVVIFLNVARGRRITQDTIFGAIAVYLLIAISFASIYILLETIQPGTFYYSIGSDLISGMHRLDFFYFSIITLSTVGFGDILPLTPYAKIFVMLEGISGIFYIAILVARLVAAHGVPGNTHE